MNIIDTKKYNETPQPFSALMDLIVEHGESEVLEGLADFFSFALEDLQSDPDACKSCIRKFAHAAGTLHGVANHFAPSEEAEE